MTTQRDLERYIDQNGLLETLQHIAEICEEKSRTAKWVADRPLWLRRRDVLQHAAKAIH